MRTIRANADCRRRHVEFLPASVDRLSGRFANYYFTRDFDAFWDKVLVSDPNAALIRPWRDTGLHDGAGVARPGVAAWRSVLSRPLR